MKINLFSTLLVILILTLVAKASILFDRVQEQTQYALDTSATSVLIGTAYAEQNNSQEDDQNGAREKIDLLKQSAPEIKFSNHKNEIVKGTDKENIKHHKQTLPTQNNIVNPTNVDNSEVKLLKELSKRREELNKNQEDLIVKEQVLKATENKIDQKMNELKSLQTQLEIVMKQYDTKENAKVMSLVKIYENMRPREAAKIFDGLEMPVLLQVVSNMKEIKVAPVIANMNPSRARELSIELAKAKTVGN